MPVQWPTKMGQLDYNTGGIHIALYNVREVSMGGGAEAHDSHVNTENSYPRTQLGGSWGSGPPPFPANEQKCPVGNAPSMSQRVLS